MQDKSSSLPINYSNNNWFCVSWQKCETSPIFSINKAMKENLCGLAGTPGLPGAWGGVQEGSLLQREQRWPRIQVSCFTNGGSTSPCGPSQEGCAQLFRACLDVPIPNLRHLPDPSCVRAISCRRSCGSSESDFSHRKKIPSENHQLALPALPYSLTTGDSSPSESQSGADSQGVMLTGVSPRRRDRLVGKNRNSKKKQ